MEQTTKIQKLSLTSGRTINELHLKINLFLHICVMPTNESRNNVVENGQPFFLALLVGVGASHSSDSALNLLTRVMAMHLAMAVLGICFLLGEPSALNRQGRNQKYFRFKSLLPYTCGFPLFYSSPFQLELIDPRVCSGKLPTEKITNQANKFELNLALNFKYMNCQHII